MENKLIKFIWNINSKILSILALCQRRTLKKKTEIGIKGKDNTDTHVIDNIKSET
jgi:hypothetical protein